MKIEVAQKRRNNFGLRLYKNSGEILEFTRYHKLTPPTVITQQQQAFLSTTHYRNSGRNKSISLSMCGKRRCQILNEKKASVASI